jgi:hypothetical protein
MEFASFNCAVVASVLFSLSAPARSTIWNIEDIASLPPLAGLVNERVYTACDLLEPEFNVVFDFDLIFVL